MKSRQLLFLAVAVLLAVSSASAQTVIRKGDDGLTTPGGGLTRINLSGFPIQQVFGASLQSNPVVNLKGESLGTGALDGVDAIVRRQNDVNISNGFGSGSLEIVALRLKGQSPVVIGGKSYTLRIFLSEFRDDVQPGTVTYTRSNGDGGTFNSSFTVRPKLVFTDSSGNSTSIDCGAVDCGVGSNLSLTAQGANFTISGGPGGFDPRRKGIKTLPAGLAVDGDGDGVAELTTQASSNLFIGVIPAAPNFPIGPVDKNEQFGGSHNVFVPVPVVSAAKFAADVSDGIVFGTFTPTITSGNQ